MSSGRTVDAVLEGLPFQKLHGDERSPVAFADFVNGANVGVVEGGGGAGLALEAFQGLTVFRKLVRQEFQGDEAPELGVLRLVYDTHPAAPKFFENRVVRDGLANHWANLTSLA